MRGCGGLRWVFRGAGSMLHERGGVERVCAGTPSGCTREARVSQSPEYCNVVRYM